MNRPGGVVQLEHELTGRGLLDVLAAAADLGADLGALVVEVRHKAAGEIGGGPVASSEIRAFGPDADCRIFLQGATRAFYARALDDGDTSPPASEVSRVRLTSHDRHEVQLAPGIGRRSFVLPLEPVPLETVAIEVFGGFSGASLAVSGRLVDTEGRARSEWIPFPLQGGALFGRLPLVAPIPSTGSAIEFGVDGTNDAPFRGWLRADAIRRPAASRFPRVAERDHLDELIRRVESGTTTFVDAADVRELSAVAANVIELGRALARFVDG